MAVLLNGAVFCFSVILYKMIRYRIFYPLLILLAVFSFSCNRKDEDSSAGKGGNATLKITPVHHTKYIDSCRVYIKYNAVDAPSGYDDSTWAVTVNGVPVASFTELKKGSYYIFGTGWDDAQPAGASWWNVKGGIPYTITEEKEINLTLPITEDH